ncbi:hypothetical protein K435DRAFT_697155 [Dendrothele bispora CBS 962.96]|uniref:Uncharacterized protein n=1 Tax=Dendrothele bispora (strain CBS 962.96) TaxID=1314807 RepID=A0A4S8KV05_DENBC|nr:hypothetical protein K435DRAFT_697155 [Dendrothele bispora CBS 962.96]
MKLAQIQEWGKLQCIDTDAGDTMQSSTLCTSNEDSRDASYVWYTLLVDQNERHKRLEDVPVKQILFGQLEHLYLIRFNTSCRPLGFNSPTTIILASIRTCDVSATETIPGLDIHFYSRLQGIRVTDVQNIQGLVGQVPCSTGNYPWAIIDQNGMLPGPVYIDEDDVFAE